MRVSIIKDSNAVNVDGEAYPVDCTALPADFHALQWDGISGEIEYRVVACSHCNSRSKKPNLFINDMTAYLPYVDAWTKAKAEIEAAKERDRERMASETAAAMTAALAKQDKAMADAADAAVARAMGKAAPDAAG